jgi:hypothetical protein
LRVSGGTLRIRHGEDYEWYAGILQTRGFRLVDTCINRATAAVRTWR